MQRFLFFLQAKTVYVVYTTVAFFTSLTVPKTLRLGPELVCGFFLHKKGVIAPVAINHHYIQTKMPYACI